MGWHLLWRKTLISLFLCTFFSVAAVSNKSTLATNAQQQTVTPIYKPIDLEDSLHSETEPYRKEFLKPFGQKKLKQILEDGENYRLYVRAKLKEMNMPAAIEYIPVIESEYKPTARSKDGKGVGMWQFMMNSIAPHLTVNEWIDERLDPWKETDAALKKLQDNYKMFGDWLLAIAAYNCGAGAMKRAIAATAATASATTTDLSAPDISSADLSSTATAATASSVNLPATVSSAKQKITFWDVAQTSLIPDHTKRYIPKLLAIADLTENAAYYEIDLPSAKDKKGNPINPHCADFDYIEVNYAVALRVLSSELRIDVKLLEELNPALIYGITPPNKSYMLRLPKGMKEAAQIYIKKFR